MRSTRFSWELYFRSSTSFEIEGFLLPKQFAKFAQPPKKASCRLASQNSISKKRSLIVPSIGGWSHSNRGVFCGKKLDILVLGGCKINLVVAAVASFLTYPVSCSVWLVGCDRSLRLQRSSAWPFSPMSNEEAMVEARHGPGTPQIHEFSNGWKSYRRQPRAFGIFREGNRETRSAETGHHCLIYG